MRNKAAVQTSNKNALISTGILMLAALTVLGTMVSCTTTTNDTRQETPDAEQMAAVYYFLHESTSRYPCIIPARKPVIYLYPETETKVSVELEINGEFLALNPEFNLPNGWEVTAKEDGTIIYNDREYPHLFWEADLFDQMDFYSGFCISGDQTEAFLKEKLPELGLNEKESADFIDYWLPEMKDNSYNVISFQTKAYTSQAQLNITPQPDSINRIFMAWYPSDKQIPIPQQLLPEPEAREGFVVTEWGGAKVDG